MSVLSEYSPKRYIKVSLLLTVMAIAVHFAMRACRVDLGSLFESLLVNGDVYLRFIDLDFSTLWLMLKAAAITVLLAALATPLAACLSIIVAIAGARNISKPWFRLPARISLGLERSLPDTVVLFVFIAAFGVGVFPAVFALALGSLGMLGKLWADGIEEVDDKSLEAIRANGGSLWQSIRYGIIPQVMPAIISNSIFRFEVNVRAATVLGGLAGVGIGYELSRAYSLLEYGRMGMAIVVIVVVVHLCERLSGYARSKLLVSGGLE